MDGQYPVQVHIRVFQTWQGENIRENLEGLIRDVENSDHINIHRVSEIKSVDGFVGNFRTTVRSGDAEKLIDNGVAILATGARELKPDPYLYGKDPRVITGQELERKFLSDDICLASVKTAAFIQCVGSRIKERPYCSKVCCTQSVKNALKLKTMNPEMNVFVICRDMRTYGLREDLYKKARKTGVRFIHYDSKDPLEVTKNGEALSVVCKSRVLHKKLEIRPDLLVLAAASAGMPAPSRPLPTLKTKASAR